MACKPREGDVYRNMCETRKKFKQQLKKCHALILGKKLTENLEDGNQANFWRKLNRNFSYGSSEQNQCQRIGEASSVSEILWREHFRKITNSHTDFEIVCHQEIFEKELNCMESPTGVARI